MARSSSYKSCNLTKADVATITVQLATLAKRLSEDGGSDADILVSVAAEKLRLEDACKQLKHQLSMTRTPKRVRESDITVPVDLRKPMDVDPGDSHYEHLDSSNLDYFARVELAKQLVFGHPIFDNIIDELPLAITGSQSHLSGAQATHVA